MATFNSLRAVAVPKNPEILSAESQWTDISNAKLFCEMFKDQACYSKDFGGWYIYNGKVWQRDKNSEIKNFAVETYERLRKYLAEYDINNRHGLEAYSRHVKVSGNNGRLNAMLSCAEAFMGVSLDKFDSNLELFNFNNGTMNLKTFKFQPFDPTDFLTKISPIDYIPEAQCPLWLKFLDEVFLGNKSNIEFIQRAVGYSMTSSIKEHCMFILYGSGRNGKTTLISTIAKIFGTYTVNILPDSIMQKKNEGIPNDIARLKGPRLVTVSENKENVTLEEALIKRLTGGDIISARFLNKEWFDFYPIFKIFLYTNKKPNIHGTDPGIWSRIRMIPMELNLPIEKRDQMLLEKLEKELPGILIWALQGCWEWQTHGLQTPKDIVDATVNYQNEEDDIGQFIVDHCVIDEKGYIPVEIFKVMFKQINGYHKSQKTIAEYMRRKGYLKIDNRVKLPNGEQVRAYAGIRMRDRNTTGDFTVEEQPRIEWND